jgi:DNA-binding transcriptional LysR family regulator
MDTITLAELRSFVAVAKARGITGAGARLGLRKAAVSKALARLETKLSVRLFERSTRRLAITPAGELLLRRAEALLADVDELSAELEHDATDVRGTLTVAAPPELGVALVDRLFAPFLAEHPRLHFSLRLDYAFHDLFDPTIDLAFRVGAVKDESLVARPLGSFERVLVAASSFVRRHAPSTPSDLSKLPCLAFDELGFASSWLLTNGREERTVEGLGRFNARSYPAILEAARAGLGVAFLPHFVVAPLLATKQLARVLPRWRSPPVPLFLIHRVGQTRVRRVKAFLDHVSEHSTAQGSILTRSH